MENEHPIALVVISDTHRDIIVSQVWTRSVKGINNIVCRDPFVANESFIRKILKWLHPRDTVFICDNISCSSVSTNSIDTESIDLFIDNAISFTWLWNTSQQAIKKYMKSLLDQEKYRVISLEDGEIQDYAIYNNQCYWHKNQVRVIDLIAVLFPESWLLTK